MRAILLVALAFLIAGATAVLARNWLADQRAVLAQSQGGAAKAPMAKVLVAKADIGPGEFIRKDHLRWQDWPEAALLPAYAVQGKRSEADFEGAVTRIPIVAGEPVIEARVAMPGDRGFLAAVLEPGMRAITVPITNTSGNAGFVFPGDRVDLILTSQIEEEGRARQFADTVIEGVRVLAIDQRLATQGQAAPGKTATLEVTPAMAERVALALQMGTLSLSLRSLDRRKDPRNLPLLPEAGPTPTLDRALYAPPEPPEAEPAPPSEPVPATVSPTVLLLRGGESLEVKF